MATKIPLGPIDSPPYDAIPTLVGENSAPANEEALRAALSPLVLGSFDERIVAWLVVWEPHVVATVCSWLERVRAEAASRG